MRALYGGVVVDFSRRSHSSRRKLQLHLIYSALCVRYSRSFVYEANSSCKDVSSFALGRFWFHSRRKFMQTIGHDVVFHRAVLYKTLLSFMGWSLVTPSVAIACSQEQDCISLEHLRISNRMDYRWISNTCNTLPVLVSSVIIDGVAFLSRKDSRWPRVPYLSQLVFTP